MELHLPFEFSKDFKLIVEAMVPENKLTRRGRVEVGNKSLN